MDLGRKPVGWFVAVPAVGERLLHRLSADQESGLIAGPRVRPAVAEAHRHLTPIVTSGVVVGLLLAFSTTVVTRWGRPWFTLFLGIVIGVMMISYVAVPARLIGVQPTQSRRDKLWTAAVGGAVGATVCTPPYLLGRIGILMLGSSVLLIPGILLIAVGVMLEAGATGAVRAIKMSAKLTVGPLAGDTPAQTPDAADGLERRRTGD